MTEVDTLIFRLKKLGIHIKIDGNCPWVYLGEVNGHRVTEIHLSEHGFTIAYLPTRRNQRTEFLNISELFKTIRRHLND